MTTTDHTSATMKTVEKIIKNRLLGGKITLHSSYEDIVEYINHRTPTAYGSVAFTDLGEIGSVTVLDRPTKNNILKLISKLQGSNNSNIITNSKIEDFVKSGERLVKMLHGGSAGKILLLENAKNGQLFIRKVAASVGVEGNGTPKLEAEINFLIKINESKLHNRLTELYPRIIDHSLTGKFIILDQEYIGKGKNVLTMLSENDIRTDNHVNYFKDLLSTLIPHGYNLTSRLISEEESLEQLEDYYLRRAEGRIKFLQGCDMFEMDFLTQTIKLLSDFTKRQPIVINNISYQHPLEVIDLIRSDSAVMNKIRPRTEGFCAHGDMTFLNMIFDDKNEAYRLIDNRGHFGDWDPLYDFGKLKFTLSGFGKIMNKEFTLSEDADGVFRLDITGNSDGRSSLEMLNASFFDNVSSHPAFATLTEEEPYWKERILLAEAIHYLSDIPHRLLLDQSPKHAVAALLFGTIYLNELYNTIQVNNVV